MSNATSGGATDVKLAPNAGRLTDASHGLLIDAADKLVTSENAFNKFLDAIWAEGKRAANVSESADPEFYYELVRASYDHLKDTWSDEGLYESEKALLTNPEHPGMYSVRYVLDTPRKDLPPEYKDKTRCNGRDIRERWQDDGHALVTKTKNALAARQRQYERLSNPNAAQSHDALLSHKDLVKTLRRHNKGAAKDMPIHSSAFYNAAVKELKRLRNEFKDHVPALPEDL